MVDLPHPPPDFQPPRDTSRGFTKVSRKLARRTTDLLGVAILAVGLLTIGGKVGRWWSTDPNEVAAPGNAIPPLEPWDAEGRGVSLEWGELNYAIHHQILSGDAIATGDRLEEIVVQKLPQIILPAVPPADAEKQLLAELKEVPISRRLDSETWLYRFGPQLPLVILTKPAVSETDPPTSETRRVVCWARAFPQSKDQWMVFLFYPAERDVTQVRGELAVPLPEGCQRIQRIQDASGQSWLGFRGAGPVEEWQRHFDGWFKDHHWKRLRTWSKIGSARTAVFQSRHTRQRADIWLNPTVNAMGEGMVFLNPLESAQAKP